MKTFTIETETNNIIAHATKDGRGSRIQRGELQQRSRTRRPCHKLAGTAAYRDLEQHPGQHAGQEVHRSQNGSDAHLESDSKPGRVDPHRSSNGSPSHC